MDENVTISSKRRLFSDGTVVGTKKDFYPSRKSQLNVSKRTIKNLCRSLKTLFYDIVRVQ